MINHTFRIIYLGTLQGVHTVYKKSHLFKYIGDLVKPVVWVVLKAISCSWLAGYRPTCEYFNFHGIMATYRAHPKNAQIEKGLSDGVGLFV